MRVIITKNSAYWKRDRDGAPFEVLLTNTQPLSGGSLQYLLDIQLGAMVHNSKAGYINISPLYNEAHHYSGRYGWVPAHFCEVVPDINNNQQALHLLKNRKE